MNKLLSHLEIWKVTKNKILNSENYKVDITAVFGESKKSRCINIDTKKLMARATLWETGELELEALDIDSEKQVIHKTLVALGSEELDEKLNWWFNEVSNY